MQTALLTPDPRGPFTVWRQPLEGRSYVVGADTASGTADEDYSAAVVIDQVSGAQMATWRGKCEPHDFGHIVFAIMLYFKGKDDQAFVVPEINNHGIAVLDCLKEVGAHRIYTRQTWDQAQMKWKSQLGWQTSVKTRPMLIGRGRTALQEQSARIFDPVLIDEMAKFVMVFDKDMRFQREDHVPGGHDDVLFAWMMAQEGRVVLVDRGEGGVPEEAEEKPNPKQWVWDKLNEQVAAVEGNGEVSWMEDW